jgi:hypothetical protein
MPFCRMLAALQVGLRYRGMDGVLSSFFFFCCLLNLVGVWCESLEMDVGILLVWIVGGI